MFSKRLSLVLAGFLVLASLAACAPLPPITQAPAEQVVPPKTVAAAATSAPAMTPTLAPTATPAIPDPKVDPAAALLYASNGKLFKTAEFTYTMSVNMAAADDASVKALGVQADQLKNFKMEANGAGALEVTDPNSLKSKLRMDMDLNAVGQQMKMQMVMIDQAAWVKLAGQDTWQKVEASQAKSVVPGMNPEQMLEDFKNAVDVKWIEDVTQGGQELSHLQFSIDPSKLDLASLTANATGSAELTPEQLQGMFKDMKPVVDVWLTKQGLELRGEKMQLDFVMPLPAEANAGDAKIKLAMIMDMKFNKVNEPVTIEPPAE